MKQPRLVPSRLLPPVGKPRDKAVTPSGRPVGWVEGYAGTPRTTLSGHALRAALVSAGAPVSLASPLPGVAVLVTQAQLSNNTWVTAGTVEVSGIRVVNFYIKNIDENENAFEARPFRLIGGERFLDDGEDPYLVLSEKGVRIPVVCDCETIGLEVRDFIAGAHARYTVGVGFTP